MTFALDFFREKLHRALASDRVDFLGITEKLLLDRNAHSEALEWIRLQGMVHLFTASGIHLYVLSDLVDAVMKRLGEFWRVDAAKARTASFALQGMGWLWIWALSDFRWGLLRPLLLVLLRKGGHHLGTRWRPWSPLVAAAGIEILAALVVWVGALFMDEAMPEFRGAGRLHYVLAVGGGLAGYEWAKRSKSVFVRHLSLAWFSWTFTAVVDLATTGRISPWTALLSLATIPAMTGFFYPVFLILTFLSWSFSGGDAVWIPALQAISILWNEGVFFLARGLSVWGGYLELSRVEVGLAFLTGISGFLGWTAWDAGCARRSVKTATREADDRRPR